MGFAKKSAFHRRKGTLQSTTAPGSSSSDSQGSSLKLQIDEDDDDWYKFDDDKVSVFPREKLSTLDGGGEDSSAYVLLYRSKPLA